MKQSCKECIAQVLGEETPALLLSLREMIKEEVGNSLKSLQPSSDTPGKTSVGTVQVSSSDDEGPAQAESVDLDSSSSSGEDTTEDSIFRSEDIDLLLKSVRATMQLEEPKVDKSVEDRMFEGLENKKKRVFPIHKNVWGLIRREWKHPDRKVFFQRAQRRKYPFDEEAVIRGRGSLLPSQTASIFFGAQTDLFSLENADKKEVCPGEVKGPEVSCFPSPQGPSVSLGNDGAAVGGRLKFFLHQWGKISNNSWILTQLREGLVFSFLNPPPTRFLVTKLTDMSKHSALVLEIEELLKKEVLIPVPVAEEGKGFYSSLFLVKKPDETFRVILNLKPLNKFIVHQTFKMETIKSAVELLFPHCYMVCVDLKDAYYHIPIHPDFQKYLRVAVKMGERTLHFQYKALPFGIKIAPRIFTKIVSEMTAHLRESEGIIVPYLDDFLLVGESIQGVQKQLKRTLDVMKNLGWIVNREKSSLIPSKRQKFLGIILDSEVQKSFLPVEKVKVLQDLSLSLRALPATTIRKAMSLLGLFTAAIPAVPWAQIHSRPLQLQILAVWDHSKEGLDADLVLSQKNYRFPSMVDSVNQSRGGQVMEKGQDGGPDHRCQPLRLGRSFAWANFPRKMGKGRRGRKILELQRTVSGSKNHSSRKGKSERKTHTNPDRQYYGSVLHQQAGGHKMRGPNADNLQPFCLSGRKFSFPFSSPHKRRRKRKSRLSKSTFSSQVRMVVEQTSIQNDCGPLGLPRDRFIRYQEEPSGREVLLTKSTGETLGGRCALSGMELGSSLCVPPSASNSQSPGKDQGGKSKCDSYCPLLAQKGMVHPGPIPADNRAMGTAGQGGFAVAGSNSSPPAKRVTSDGMAFEREILRKKGFSEAVISTLQKSKKPVTYSLYYKVWRAFDRFCTERGYPLEYDIKVLLEFLQRGLDSGLKPATLKVQVSALSAFLNRSLASNPWVIRFIKAAMRLLPTRRSIVPPWDLSLVLNALTREPFEPLQDISMRCLTLKAVFLVAVTTARRVGEISALVHNHPYTQILDDRIILRTDPAFLPKVVSAFHRNEEVVLPSFCSSPSSAGERVFHTLDVRRTLIEYLHRSSQWRKSRSLFVQFAGPQKGSKASKNSIARWIKQAIQLAYSKANMQVPKQLKAHSTRAVSTSWAEFQSASVDQICKAATWSSQSTFFRHYRLDLSDSSSLSFGRKVLQTVVPP